jgi:ribosomal-protein-alanine N-acetyltransferase
MPEARIKIRDDLHLSSIRETDKPALVEHLQAKSIYETTLNIPYPYSDAHAEAWIHKRLEHSKDLDKEVSFVIRDGKQMLIGAVGAVSLQITHDSALLTPEHSQHRAEIGYWLAETYWGRGIMTDAVRCFVRYAFNELELLRLTAHVFEFNVASARVLEKNGFKLEGYLRKHFSKDGQLLDARLYGLLKDEVSKATR